MDFAQCLRAKSGIAFEWYGGRSAFDIELLSGRRGRHGDESHDEVGLLLLAEIPHAPLLSFVYTMFSASSPSKRYALSGLFGPSVFRPFCDVPDE